MLGGVLFLLTRRVGENVPMPLLQIEEWRRCKRGGGGGLKRELALVQGREGLEKNKAHDPFRFGKFCMRKFLST